MTPSLKTGGLRFFPRAGQVLICDFAGYVPPEIVKIRPVAVVSPKLPNRSGLATVVPLSTTAPRHDEPYVVELSQNYHPNSNSMARQWAKCDLITNVTLKRLDRFKVARRQYVVPELSAEDLLKVRHAMLHALGFGALIK